MLVVIFSESKDYSTCLVKDWLDSLGFESVIFNEQDKLRIISTKIEDNKIEVVFENSQKEFDFSEIVGSWYRRGIAQAKIIDDKQDDLISQINHHLKGEFSSLYKFVHYFLDTKLQNRIGSPLTDTGVDKTKMLVEAQKAGLSIPKTLITSKKEELLKFQQKNQQLITKGIQGVAFFSFQDTQLGNYTEVVTEETIAVAPLTFFPSLFQELLDKDYELRIFYIHKELYAMAIFSQLDSQTMVDFRKYNNTKPNRNVPYKLPEAIANKIINFMEAMQLNSGSLDMVVTKTGEYVFLEVNPVGQFGMVSAPCNYFIEKRIAQLLTQ